VFKADVTSFSFFNLDVPLTSPVTLTVTVYDDPDRGYYNQIGTIPAPGVAVTVDILESNNSAVWQGRGITDQNGELELVVPPGFLRVVGKKGTDTYNGFVYEENFGSASIDLFKFAPPLLPPDSGDNDLIQVVLVAGTNFSGPTRFLVVEDASILAEFWSAGGDWRPVELLYDVYVVGIVGNTIELNEVVNLSEFGLVQGSTVTFESNI
jgi:hypothetical protein